MPYSPDVTAYTEGRLRVRHACEQAGRQADTVTAALFATVLVTNDPGSGRATAERYCQGTYGLPLTALEQIQLIAIGTASEVSATLAQYVDSGASHLVIRVATLEHSDQPDQIAEEILPALRGRVPS